MAVRGILRPASTTQPMRRSRDVLCAAYLTRRPDPQRGYRVRRNTFGYMRAWWSSVHELGLHAIVVHDELSPAFVRRYTTDRIAFVQVPPDPWTPNDARFFLYRDLIARRGYGRAFLTDIADVRVVQNPFPVLEAPAAPLAVGDEVYAPPLGTQIRTHPWLRRKIGETSSRRSRVVHEFFRRHDFDFPTLNVGVLGGRAPELLDALDRFARVRRAIGHPERNLNMPVLNYVLHRFFRGRFHHGAPVTSLFKGFERRRRDVCFIHK